MIKRLDKKGQSEGTGLGTIFAIILGGIAVLIIILGFTVGFDKIFGFFKKSDVDITFISNKCNTVGGVEGGTVSSYCYDTIELKSNTYINCQYAYTTLGAQIEDVNVPKDVSGTPNLCEDGPSKICARLKTQYGSRYDENKVTVNDQLCSTWINGGVDTGVVEGGEEVTYKLCDVGTSSCLEKKSVLTDEIKQSNPYKVCVDKLVNDPCVLG